MSVIYIWSVAFFGLAPTAFLEDLSSWSLRESQRSATADNSFAVISIRVSSYRDRY